MPMQNKIEVINVTADVYDEQVVRAQYEEECDAGNYRPFIRIHSAKVRGVPRTAFCVCRFIDSDDDRVFVEFLKATEKRKGIKFLNSFVSSIENDRIVIVGEDGGLHDVIVKLKRDV